MIVPKYWAEGTASAHKDKKSITLRRFGWSDESQQAAETHARQRADEALARVLAGEKLPKRDPKVPYNGSRGLPIREEIVATYGDAVITRNSYGALCLNTPDVLFADVDVQQEANAGLYVPTIAFAACRFVDEFGSGSIHPKAREVRDVHDKLARANGQLPLA